jgi:MraZ protein
MWDNWAANRPPRAGQVGEGEQMFAFIGEFERNLDDKARLVVPPRFRAALEDGYFVTRGLDGCLWLFPQAAWEALSAKLSQSSIVKGGARRLDRMLFAGTDGELDGQARLSLPPSLRNFAALEPNGPAVVVGVKNRIEIWEPSRWAAVSAEAAEDSEFAEELEGLGI